MMKRVVLWSCLLLGLGFSLSFLYKAYRPLLMVYYLHYTKTLDQKEADAAAWEGARLAMGYPPSEIAEGMSHFTLKGLPTLTLHVPREYISFRPKEPDGERERLSLSFYLPGMQSWQSITKTALSNYQIKARKVTVSLSAKNQYINCCEDECLGPEFALYQSAINWFQARPPEDPVREACVNQGLESGQSTHNCPPEPQAPRCLTQGCYEPSLQLRAYRGIDKTSSLSGEDLGFDFIYLQPDANPSNPKEWIKCRGCLCRMFWFWQDIWVEASFQRRLLPYHARIRSKVDQALNGLRNNDWTQHQHACTNLGFPVGGVEDRPQEMAMAQLREMRLKQVLYLTKRTLKNLLLPLALADVQARIEANDCSISLQAILDHHTMVFEERDNLPGDAWRDTVFDKAMG